jgi:ketosteroid isomerase-like protein
MAMTGLLMAAAAAATPALPADLAAAVAAYDRAQVASDRAALERLLADDYLLVNSRGATETKAQFIADQTAPGYRLDPFDIEQPVARVWPGGAAVGGVARLTGEDGGARFDVRLRFTDVWAKRRGRWQVIYTHASRAP